MIVSPIVYSKIKEVVFQIYEPERRKDVMWGKPADEYYDFYLYVDGHWELIEGIGSSKVPIVPCNLSAFVNDAGYLSGSNVAYVENSSTASKSYSEGDYLIYDSTLYKATTAINEGDTIEVGVNVVSTTLTDEIGSGGGGGLQSFEFIECNITAVDGSDKATVSNNNWHTEAIAAYEAKKIPVLYGQAISSGTIYSMILTVEKYTAGGDDYRIYGSAAITVGGSSPRRNILYAEMQSTHSTASIYISDFVDKLVSGKNIKTVNGNSIVGSGNVTIPTGLSVAYEVVDAGMLYLDQTNTYYEVPAMVYTALKAVWNAGKVPVLTGNLNDHTTGFALIPTTDNGNMFYCYWHAYSTMNNHRWHVSGQISSTGGRLIPEEEQKPITVDQSVQAGSTNPVSGDAVYESFEDIETILDAILGSQVLNNGMERMLHTEEVAATLSPEIVHIFTGDTDTLAITLTAPTDALSHLFTMILTTGTTPAVTIQVSDSTAIIYPDDYAIEAGTTYEISVLYANGKYYLRYVTYQEA